MNIGLLFVAFFPMVIWIGAIAAIVAAVKGNFKKSPGHRAQQKGDVAKSRQNGRVTSQRPQMQKGLFDMNLDRRQTAKEKKGFSFGSSRNTGFDTYEAKSRRKDFVDDYDRKLSKSSKTASRAAGMQFSHTYDGHEPWDKCLPKEKDPWDPDFYA